MMAPPNAEDAAGYRP